MPARSGLETMTLQRRSRPRPTQRRPAWCEAPEGCVAVVARAPTLVATAAQTPVALIPAAGGGDGSAALHTAAIATMHAQARAVHVLVAGAVDAIAGAALGGVHPSEALPLVLATGFAASLRPGAAGQCLTSAPSWAAWLADPAPESRARLAEALSAARLLFPPCACLGVADALAAAAAAVGVVEDPEGARDGCVCERVVSLSVGLALALASAGDCLVPTLLCSRAAPCFEVSAALTSAAATVGAAAGGRRRMALTHSRAGFAGLQGRACRVPLAQQPQPREPRRDRGRVDHCVRARALPRGGGASHACVTAATRRWTSGTGCCCTILTSAAPETLPQVPRARGSLLALCSPSRRTGAGAVLLGLLLRALQSKEVPVPLPPRGAGVSAGTIATVASARALARSGRWLGCAAARQGAPGAPLLTRDAQVRAAPGGRRAGQHRADECARGAGVSLHRRGPRAPRRGSHGRSGRVARHDRPPALPHVGEGAVPGRVARRSRGALPVRCAVKSWVCECVVPRGQIVDVSCRGHGRAHAGHALQVHLHLQLHFHFNNI